MVDVLLAMGPGAASMASAVRDAVVLDHPGLGRQPSLRYFEEHHFGNVGGYRSWYVGVNDFGYNAFPVAVDWFDVADLSHTRLLPDPRDGYRVSAPINTVVVSGIALCEEVQNGTFFGISLGVDQDQVRPSDPEYHVLDSRIGRAHRRIRAWRWHP
ncbi:ETEC_3214 domain-containing protein [Streptomyces spiralis]|uniref:ETEC_3214 domain-containing protein n=1 Tax=Streptomyces spiralis TaxID=66376 RepID=UPI00335EE092